MASKHNKARARVVAQLPDDLADIIESIARREGERLAVVVRRLLRAGLKAEGELHETSPQRAR